MVVARALHSQRPTGSNTRVPVRAIRKGAPVQHVVVVQVLHPERGLQEEGPHLALPQKVLGLVQLAAGGGERGGVRETEKPLLKAS